MAEARRRERLRPSLMSAGGAQHHVVALQPAVEEAPEADRKQPRVHIVRFRVPPGVAQHVRAHDDARDPMRLQPFGNPPSVAPDLVADDYVARLRQPQGMHLRVDGRMQRVYLPLATEGAERGLLPRHENGMPAGLAKVEGDHQGRADDFFGERFHLFENLC